MVNNIEQANIETGWWSEGKINAYQNNLKGKEIGKNKTELEHLQAEELLKKIESTDWAAWDGKTWIQKNVSISNNEVKVAINNLWRPEAQKGIEQSYATMESTIKNSKNESGIAWFIGKIMNKILG